MSDDDSRTPTKHLLSYSSRLFLSKQLPSVELRAHPRLIHATAQDILGPENRVSENRPLRLIWDRLNAGEEAWPMPYPANNAKPPLLQWNSEVLND